MNCLTSKELRWVVIAVMLVSAGLQSLLPLVFAIAWVLVEILARLEES